MLAPILPLYLLREAGLSFTLVTIVMAAAGVGSMLSQLPVGVVLAKTAEKRVMLAALVVLAASTVLLGFTLTTVGLAALRFTWGIGSTGWLLSRQTLMTRAAPAHVRGRAMSLFGGTARFGQFAGALLGGFLAEAFGFATAFGVIGVITIMGVFPLLIDKNPMTSTGGPPPTRPPRLFDGFRQHGPLLALAGGGQVATIAVRTGHQVLLPLIGAGIGLNLAEVGVLVAIGRLADLMLFPLAGYIMDRFGRLYAIVPAFCGLGVGFLMLAAAEGYTAVVVAATVIGLANSIGSGTMLTLASDLAPPANPSPFLASLGTIRESGKIAGPVLVGWLADVAGLPTASVALGCLAFLATALIVFGIGETRDRAPTLEAAL
ncbi:MAG: MFS family permease [Acidimicrobiales bacterium]|jgi:MFS family permease